MTFIHRLVNIDSYRWVVALEWIDELFGLALVIELHYATNLQELISLAIPGEKIKRYATMKICLDYVQEDFQSRLD